MSQRLGRRSTRPGHRHRQLATDRGRAAQRRHRVSRARSATQHATQTTEPGQRLGRGRRRAADQADGLGDLREGVGHTGTEVRQTLGVVEEAGEGAVAVHRRSQAGGQAGLPGQQEPQFRQRVGGGRRRRWSHGSGLDGRACGGLRQRLQGLRRVGRRRVRRRVGDRRGLGGLSGRVGHLRCILEGRHVGRRRGLARVAVHRARILRPHLAVLGLQLRDQRGVLPQHVRHLQLLRLHPVGGDQRGRHRRGQRGLIGRGGRTCLGGSLLGLSGRGGHPCGVGSRRLGHRRRGRAGPLLAAQRGDDLLVAQRRRVELGRQRAPRRGGGHQGPRPRTRINSRRIELRRKRSVIQHH
ncbi:hypothetical protein MYSE111917_27450 [Mycobacterium senriense]